MKITSCRLCDGPTLDLVVDLGYHPLADTFLPPDLQYGPEVSYPLQLGACRSCGHVATLYSVSAVERYQAHEYSYDSSNSRVSIQHFKEFADAVLGVHQPSENALIVDIGSNVGTLLSHFKDAGHAHVVGVEPASNIARLAVSSGIPTLNNFFDGSIVAPLREAGGVEILLSSNVVNHADDLRGLLRTARDVMKPDGIFVFEVPYLLDLVRGTAFDTIYHEHVHYYGVKPLAECLAGAGFSIFRIDFIDYMCGSIRVFTRMGGKHERVVEEAIAREQAFGLYQADTWRKFRERVRRVKFSVTRHLAEIRDAGGKIIGIGAATKGNTFLNYCQLDADTVAYIADASPLKVGKLTPGSHIPIVADGDIDKSATHALILPWNIAPMLQTKLAHLGLKFYVPQVETLHDTKS
ncbi:MAG TPA: class I SAM-dependent methyltransferase [Steroidobacteraceae bacterium]|nr:class I SAM-dependent methyltransferase [Steroidobacteraceae bacterium]